MEKQIQLEEHEQELIREAIQGLKEAQSGFNSVVNTVATLVAKREKLPRNMKAQFEEDGSSVKFTWDDQS